MITSMTGFGKGSTGNSRLSAEVEVKSVNSRYLDISIKLPPALSNKEYELREIIRTKVKRGKLSVFVQVKTSGITDSETAVDKDKLKNFIGLVKEIKKTAKLTDKIKVAGQLMEIMVLDHLIISSDGKYFSFKDEGKL